MFKKVLSSLGVQGVQVNTVLTNPQLQVGQNLQGAIHFTGASSSKRINGIYLELMTMVEVESGDHEARQAQCIARWPISGAFDLLANQRHECPFNLQLPLETPITQLNCHYNHSQVWLHTHLDIDWAIDAHDDDALAIYPSPTMQALITALEQCGLSLYSADVERGQLRGGHFQSTIGCYQELEFRPTAWLSSLNELEVSFVTTHDQTHVLFEVDRKMCGDHYRTLSLPHTPIDIASLSAHLKQLLQL